MTEKGAKKDAAKPGTYPDTRRRQFVQLINRTDQYWMDVLGDKLFHDLNYYDLFTQMWLRHNHIFHKSELHRLMPNISQRTAVKYIQIAIDHGLLIEHADPEDQRSKRITMSADLKRKIELFLDYSISVFDAFPPPGPRQRA
ncbi:MAG TPA: MarR family transcriptional regulator [Nitrosospira sp.]